MDAIRAEAAAMTLDDDKLPTVVEGETLPTSGNNSGFNSPRGGSSTQSQSQHPSEEKRVEQKGRFTVIDDDANKSGMNSAGGSTDNLSRATSVQKGRFTVMEEDGDTGAGAVSKTSSSKALQGSSVIIGSSEPESGTVAAAAKAAIEREMDPPKLKPRRLYDAAESAGEIAKMLREMHDEMEEQQDKITVLVDDNRWLRKRVLELEAMLGQ